MAYKPDTSKRTGWSSILLPDPSYYWRNLPLPSIDGSELWPVSIRYLLERSLKFARIKAASLLETTGEGHYLNSIRVDVWCRWFLVKEAILAFPDRKRQAYGSACAYVSLVNSFLSTKPENLTCYLINYRSRGYACDVLVTPVPGRHVLQTAWKECVARLAFPSRSRVN